MNGCASAERIVSSWVQSGAIDASERSALQAHLDSCADCSRRHAALLPLILRDAGDRDALRAVVAPPADLAERVLERLPGARTRRLLPTLPRGLAYAAAAAVLLLASGGLLAYRAGLTRGARADGSPLVVRFELAAPDARSVLLIGDFTDWQEQGVALTDREGDGLWEVTVRLRKGRAYTYNFLIDGEEWVVDPKASVNVDDGFGGKSSVIVL